VVVAGSGEVCPGDDLEELATEPVSEVGEASVPVGPVKVVSLELTGYGADEIKEVISALARLVADEGLMIPDPV
jgi:hypothetical protein